MTGFDCRVTPHVSGTWATAQQSLFNYERSLVAHLRGAGTARVEACRLTIHRCPDRGEDVELDTAGAALADLVRVTGEWPR
jgi:hypothetical protein